jgi:hypothetical protein
LRMKRRQQHGKQQRRGNSPERERAVKPIFHAVPISRASQTTRGNPMLLSVCSLHYYAAKNRRGEVPPALLTHGRAKSKRSEVPVQLLPRVLQFE